MSRKNTYKWIGAAVLGAVCSIGLLTPAGAAPALAPSTAAAKDTARFGHGLLWRIEPIGGGDSSHVFGTIHSDDQRVLALPKPIDNVFEHSKSVTLEMVVDSAALLTLAEHMVYRDGRTLRNVTGETTYAEVREALRERGLPADSMESYKPWAVVLALSAPRGTPLDFLLQTRAMSAGKPVEGLETAKEQVDIFDHLALADQVALLKETLRDRRKQAARLEELTRAYLARDLAAIFGFIDKYRPADARVHKILVERLLSQRNQRMTERMEPRLKKGNAFIAIGAAHLPGADGVLQLLEQKGYRVSAVY